MINAGQVISSGGDTAAVRVLGGGASALNRGEILVTGADSVGLQGVIANTFLTNQGTISVMADVSWGMLGGGNGHQATNSGLIETQGTFAAGIVMNGRGGPLNEPGSNFEVVNAGRMFHVPISALYRGSKGLVTSLTRAQLQASATAQAGAHVHN